MEKQQGTRIVYSSWLIWNIAADAAQRATDKQIASPAALTSDTLTAILMSEKMDIQHKD